MKNMVMRDLDLKIDSELFSPLSLDEKKSNDIVRPSVGYWANAWRRLKSNKVALFSLVMIVVIITFAVFGPILVEKLLDLLINLLIKQHQIYYQMLNIGLEQII